MTASTQPDHRTSTPETPERSDRRQRLGHQVPRATNPIRGEEVYEMQEAASERHERLVIEVPDVTNPYYAELVPGVQEAAHENGYLLLLLASTEDEARERQSLESAINVVDGIVLAGTRLSDATLTHLTKRI